MNALPLSWPLEGRRVVVIGDGVRAERKVALLARTGARIDLYAVESGAFAGEDAHVHARAPQQDELTGAALVIVAVEAEAPCVAFAAMARLASAPVNVVDRPHLSDFHVPAIVDRGAITIGIGSAGAAPTLARDVRAAIEAAVAPSTRALGDFAVTIKDEMRTRFTDPESRRKAWEAILRGPAGEAARRENFDIARAHAHAVMAGEKPTGVVHIVGAGPGDPELLTLKALRLLQDADLIVHDRLVDPRILDLARRDARRVYVGKAKSAHSVAQDKIHDLMIEAARAGDVVVRLKGGDPFIFGRGGEEVDALRDAGIAVHVTPGITAALGCAASVGAPLTHRDHAQAVTFITGHAREDGGAAQDHDWRAYSGANHTLVVYMGADRAGVIAAKLIDAGRDAGTPVLLIENGTRPDQRTRLTRLCDLSRDIAFFQASGPLLVIIGDVATKADVASDLAAQALGAAA